MEYAHGNSKYRLYTIGIFNMIGPALSRMDVRDGRLHGTLRNVTVFVCIAHVA
jgi:hypothetical protein